MKGYLLAHDLGTSGNKATLFDTDGRLVASEIFEYPTLYSRDGWVEQDAEDWWEAVRKSTRNLISRTKVNKNDVLAVSFSGQMMGCLCVDRAGKPLRNAIIWADCRAVRQSAKLEQKISQWDYYHIVGHRNTPSYGIQKLLWVKENEYPVYEQTYKVLNAKDYIVYKLTGRFYTDYSDANSTGAFDINRLQWSERIVQLAGIDMEKLPVCKPSSFVAGNLLPDAARQMGLTTCTRVVLGAGDGVATNVGAGSIAPGRSFCCLGTSAWITTTTDQPIFDEQMRIVTWAHMVEGLYAPNGTMQYAGGAYNWAKNNLCALESYDAKADGRSPYDYMNRLAQKSPIGSNGVLFLPYFLGERAPRWDVNARGAFIGLTPENTRADLVRSVLEGVSLNLSLILDVLRQYIPITELSVLGGGAKGRVWRSILADVLDARLLVPGLLDEAGAMGAAVNAGVGIGIFDSYRAIDRFLKIEELEEPSAEGVRRYREIKERFDDCYFALKDFFEKYR